MPACRNGPSQHAMAIEEARGKPAALLVFRKHFARLCSRSTYGCLRGRSWKSTVTAITLGDAFMKSILAAATLLSGLALGTAAQATPITYQFSSLARIVHELNWRQQYNGHLVGRGDRVHTCEMS
jgi:hypothetical protein